MIDTMWHKEYNEFVSVYEISDGSALIYSPFLENKNHNGWSRCKLSKLIPEKYKSNSVNQSLITKTDTKVVYNTDSTVMHNIAERMLNI